MIKPTLLNTRPQALQQLTHDAFVAIGFDVITFPCIEIIDVEDIQQPIKKLAKISSKDTLVFTSQYAVSNAYKIKPNLNLDNKSTVIVVGKKTAQVLEQNYSGDIWIPEQQNSIGVIDLLKGLSDCDSIKLISADNGRDLIQNYAIEARIYFEQINVYQRQLPKADKSTIEIIENTNKLFILATSVSNLENLKILLQNKWRRLLSQTVICASSRIQTVAVQMGFKKTLNCQTANPELMAEQLKKLIA